MSFVPLLLLLAVTLVLVAVMLALLTSLVSAKYVYAHSIFATAVAVAGMHYLQVCTSWNALLHRSPAPVPCCPIHQGIAFLHSVGLIHADIKPENIALYPPSPPSVATTPATTPAKPPAPFDLRLIDLGNAVFAADALPGVTAGTPSYLSPEARRGLQWGPKVDVWAAGCVLYEIVSGGRVGTGAAGEIGFGSGPGGPRAATGGALAAVVGLVRRLLAEDADKRPTAVEALQDALFSQA